MPTKVEVFFDEDYPELVMFALVDEFGYVLEIL